MSEIHSKFICSIHTKNIHTPINTKHCDKQKKLVNIESIHVCKDPFKMTQKLLIVNEFLKEIMMLLNAGFMCV